MESVILLFPAICLLVRQVLAKTRLIVDGVVQGVGYRALVKQAAKQLGLKGLVRNFEETKVEVFCEGTDDKINELIKKIDVKAKPADFLSINVTRINCFMEGHKNYKPAWKTYVGFEIDYGLEELELSDEIALEDREFAKLYFIGFRNELAGFRENTNANFAEMAEKYGDISTELKEFRKTVKNFLDCFLSEYQKKNKH
jgi:acylphosphatase